jgi:hypothetical protein
VERLIVPIIAHVSISTVSILRCPMWNSILTAGTRLLCLLPTSAYETSLRN